MKNLKDTTLSVLDLVLYAQGKTIADAFTNTVQLAQLTENLGYKRYWMAEHHSIEGVASAATSVLIGHVASKTKTIRVGSGGIMLPNHAPLLIAEQFGTLATLYPDRIDLGLGRAPGGDQNVISALRRDHGARGGDFARMLEELNGYFAEHHTIQKVRAIPGEGIKMPIYILGSSLYSAELAARLGLPYAFAGHFAPGAMEEAFALYNQRFVSSEILQRPYTMAGINILAADTTEQAQFLATSTQQRYLGLIRGQLTPTPPPVKSMDVLWTLKEKEAVQSMTRTMIVGDKEKVRKDMQTFINQTGVDELIITTDAYDHSLKLKSFEIVMDARNS